MTRQWARRLGAAALLALSACNPPKYAAYKSVAGDFTVSAPWGWQVLTDAQGDAFAQTSFVGPFDADFYLGAPSLTVRWYKRGRPHRLRDGRLETYSNGDDFARQMLRDVYAGRSTFVSGVMGKDGREEDGPSVIKLQASGLSAKFFTVLSPTPAPEGMQWGVNVAKDGKPWILRQHAYAIVQLPSGFYVLCYPATKRGHDKYADRFRALLGSFTPLTAGPGGPKVKLPAPAKA